MQTTKTGKRTAHIEVQIVEGPGKAIRMWVMKSDTLSDRALREAFGGPINFSAETGQSGTAAWEKLHRVLDAS